MNNGGDAAEQVVRLSLEGFEVAAKLTGSAAKNVALLLVSVLKQDKYFLSSFHANLALSNNIDNTCVLI